MRENNSIIIACCIVQEFGCENLEEHDEQIEDHRLCSIV